MGQVIELRGAQERLGGRLRAFGVGREARPPAAAPLNEEPCCVYGLVTRNSLDVLAQEIAELKGRVNTLLWGLGGAVMLELVLRVAGR